MRIRVLAVRRAAASPLPAQQFYNLDVYSPGWIVVEGDTLVRPEDASAKSNGPRTALSRRGAASRWTGGVAPFIIDAAVGQRQRINDAIEHWHANTAVRVPPSTTEHDGYMLKRPQRVWAGRLRQAR
jgi:hypothetical protein